MPFAAALSTAQPIDKALDDVLGEVRPRFAGQPELALVFFSPHHAGHADKIVATLQSRLQPRLLIGCVGESIIGNDQEIEQGPALSLWLGGWSRPGRTGSRST